MLDMCKPQDLNELALPGVGKSGVEINDVDEIFLTGTNWMSPLIVWFSRTVFSQWAHLSGRCWFCKGANCYAKYYSCQ